ncbi:MAG: hypothetical protein IKN91_09685, partial [Paludibacteraceae bacterium]|nr:hypothetical protein [Paludibacteraceae bacterium]
ITEQKSISASVGESVRTKMIAKYKQSNLSVSEPTFDEKDQQGLLVFKRNYVILQRTSGARAPLLATVTKG